jgi:hypothetical protein
VLTAFRTNKKKGAAMKLKLYRFVLALTVTLVCGAVALPSDVPPTAYDIIMQAGEDYHRIIQVVQNDALTPVNLTGNTYLAQFRSTASAAAYATYSTIVTDAATGEVHLKLSNRQTTALSGKTGQWDLRETNAAGATTYLATGRCSVRPTMSR